MLEAGGEGRVRSISYAAGCTREWQLLTKKLSLAPVDTTKKAHPRLLHALALLVCHLSVQILAHRDFRGLGGPLLPGHGCVGLTARFGLHVGLGDATSVRVRSLSDPFFFE